MLKDMAFYHSQENRRNNYWTQDQKLPKKQSVKRIEFFGNKIADAVTNPNDDNIERQETVEEVIIPPEKREELLNKLRKVF